MSFFKNLLCGLPPQLNINICPIHPLFHLFTWPNHLVIAFLILSPTCLTRAIALMYSFPYKNLSSSAWPPRALPPVFSVSATVSIPRSHYHLVFPFTPVAVLQSQITPDIHLHLVHPACTLLFWVVVPRYLNSFTFNSSTPSIFNFPFNSFSKNSSFMFTWPKMKNTGN